MSAVWLVIAAILVAVALVVRLLVRTIHDHEEDR